MSQEKGAGVDVGNPPPPILSLSWREAHAREGDRLLAICASTLGTINWDKIAALSALAQAHYAAANVRARMATQPPPTSTGICPHKADLEDVGVVECYLWAEHQGLHRDKKGRQWEA